MSSEKEDTLQKAIDKYLERGFGTMNKNDFEVFIFNHLLSNSLNGKSDNAISRELRIPESKVKRLRYEATLKFQEHSENDYKQQFYDILKKRAFKTTDTDKIQFSIKDRFLRLYLSDMLDEAGSFPDSSFNSDIVTLTANDFIILLAGFEGKKDIIKAIKNSLKENQADFAQTGWEKVKKGTTALLKDIGGHFAPEVSKFIFEQIEKKINL